MRLRTAVATAILTLELVVAAAVPSWRKAVGDAAWYAASQVMTYTMVKNSISPTQLKLYEEQVQDTIAETQKTGECGIIVNKGARTLDLICGGTTTEQYKVKLGANAFNDKRKEGDMTTPEGKYKIQRVKGKGFTKFYKALLLNYPNAEDNADFAMQQKNGLVGPDDTVGSYIEIHGHGSRTVFSEGCVVVTNNEMDKLESYVHAGLLKEGSPITIVKALP